MTTPRRVRTLFAAGERLNRRDDVAVNGPADLMIEILSRATRSACSRNGCGRPHRRPPGTDSGGCLRIARNRQRQRSAL
jgi:hypothetical protein